MKVPTRVEIALATIDHLDTGCGEPHGRTPRAQAAHDAACEVLTLYLKGEHEYRDKVARVRKRATRRRRPPGHGVGARS